MKKRVLSLLLASAMVVGLTACGGKKADDPAPSKAADPAPAASQPAAPAPADVANDPKVTLIYAEVNPETSIVGQVATEFKRLVEEKSGGSITIDVKYAGVLGPENEVLDGMLAGDDSIDMSRISAFALSTYGCGKATLLSLPYTFVSRDHWWNFANSDLAKELLNEPQENGLPLRGLFYGEEGFRHFFGKPALNSIEDMKGKKVRVSTDPVMVGMVEGLGGSATNVAFTELYSNLDSGVVDVAEQPIANYKSNAFDEVAPNLILDGHTLGAIQAVITDTAWAKLTEGQQAVIMEASAEVQKFNQDLSQGEEDKVLEGLKASGCNVVDVPDKSAWQEACSAINSQYTANYAELYQQILDFAK